MRIDLGDYNKELIQRNLDLNNEIGFFSWDTCENLSCRVCPSCGTEFYITCRYIPKTLSTCLQELRSEGMFDVIPQREWVKNLTEFRNTLYTCAEKMREMDKCMICGGKMPVFPENGRVSYDEDGYCFSDETNRYADVHGAFEKLRELRLKTYRGEAEKRLQRTAEDLSSHAIIMDTSDHSNAIRSNSDLLGKYISHVFIVETAIFATEKRLQELYTMESVVHFDSLSYKGESLSKGNQELEKAKEEYTRLSKTNAASRVKVRKIDVGCEPIAPAKPTPLSAKEPKEPVYATPNLFNKKRVLSENEELKRRYQQDLEAYEKAKAAHTAKLQEYDKQRAQYKKEYAEYVVRLNEEKARAEKEFQENLAKEKELLSQKIEEAKHFVDQKQKQLDESRSAPVQSAALNLIREEITTAETTLNDLMLCRNRLYAQNVIYPKYRNMVAIASFNDYIMSGRCDALEGANGAYDKYEVECRADIIISKLTDVLVSLEEIKNNQYMLYTQISEVNNGLNKLNSTMEKAVETLKEISSDTSSIRATTSSIAAHTAQIAENSEVIAYNTEATAFYAKKNAELTNALGFLVALK